MPLPLRDYWVPFRSEGSIAPVALEWRRAGNVFNSGYFDIVDFVENVLTKQFTRKGTLKIEFFDQCRGDDAAFVTYRPLILHADKKVWKYGKMGDPECRHIIAHEIGHVILHDHYARAFSNDPSQRLKSAPKENSAEWQANTFAEYFLAPDHLVKAFADFDSLANSCSIPQELAQERKLKVQNPKRKTPGYTGEACAKCNNFTLVRSGLRQRCDTCGALTEEP